MFLNTNLYFLPHRDRLAYSLGEMVVGEDATKEGLVLQAGAGPPSRAGGAERAAGSGLWRRNIHRCGGLGLVICCLGPGRFKGLVLYALGQSKASGGCLETARHIQGIVASSLLVMLGSLLPWRVYLWGLGKGRLAGGN